MIRWARLALLGAAFALATPADADTRFLAVFDDMPLAPDLTERADAAFSFAAPEGRIAETAAAGKTEEAAARAWYRTALPALGWALEADGPRMDFVRGRERLTLAFARGSDGTLTVRYRVVARPASLALD